MFLQPPEFYLLRTPVQSIIRLYDFIELPPDQFLEQLSLDDLFMESIFIASPELYYSYRKYLDAEGNRKDLTEKVFGAVYKYYIRFCSKSTPFGLFAGYAYGVFGEKDGIKLQNRARHRRNTRLDMSYIVTLCDYLSKLPQIRNQTKYYLNNSSYTLDSKLFYTEFSVEDFTKTYRLSSVDNNEYLDGITSICCEGADLTTIISFLEEKGIPNEVAIDYVTELIDNKILLTALEPTVIGLNNLDKVISIIQKFNHMEYIQKILQTINEITKSPKSVILKTLEIKELLSELIDVKDEKNLLQLDLEIKTSANKISSKTIDQFLPELEIIFLTFSSLLKNRRLEEFKRRFIERYNENEMPLSQVLDPIYGIGYDPESGADGTDYSVFIKDLPVNLPGENNYLTDRLSEIKLKKLSEALKSGSHIVTITKNELQELVQEIPYHMLPDSYYILGSLLSNKKNNGHKLVLQNFIGSSGMNLLNRFIPENIAAQRRIKNFVRKEESFGKNKIYAEIAHLPQPRVGNVLLRPATRNYEIPYLGASNLPADRQILLKDLMVSIKGGQVVLRSLSHHKEVVPRLTTAHMYMNGVSLYKFLGDVQKQDTYDYNTWNWNELSGQDFLPRIETGNVILSPARWRLYKEIVSTGMSVPEFREKLNQITPRLPSLLILIENQQELLIDIDHTHSLNTLKGLLLKNAFLDLKECLQNPDNSHVHSDTGLHFHELIIPFHKIMPAEPVPLKRHTSFTTQDISVPYILGSEWLYFKIYCAPDTADLLLFVLKPLIDKWIAFGIIDKWFYIRYGDPDYHLRIRLHSDLPEFYSHIIRDINPLVDPFINSGKIFSVITDNYTREIGRYGTLNINSFEEISYWDSYTALKIIYLLKKNQQEDIWWLLILKNIDVLLDDLGFDIHQKLEYVKKYKTALFKEINADNSLNKTLNSEYRERQQQIYTFFSATLKKEHPEWQPIFNLLKKRSLKFKKHLKTIMTNEKKSSYQYLKEIQFGIVHLSINRFCKSEPRQHELVFYHHLEVFYVMQLNKLKAKHKDATIST